MMELKDTALLVFLLLVVCADEGFCKSRIRTSWTRSRTSYSGGGYSSGSSGSDSSGDVLAIVGGVIGGCLALSVLICVCCLCYRRARGTDKTEGVVVNRAPTSARPPIANFNQTNGVILSAPNRAANSIPTNVNQNQPGVVLNKPPLDYAEMDKPTYDVQSDIRRIQLNGSPSNYEQVTKMGVRPQGVMVQGTRVHKQKSGKSNAAFSL